MASPRDKGIEPPNPLLLEAITTSTNDRLVEALILLIQRNRQAKELAENYLLVTTSSSSSSTLEDKEQVKDTIEPQDEGNNKEYVPRGTKRVRSGSIEGDVQPSAKRIRFQICAQCEDEYDITENEQNACRWHPGEKKVNADSAIWIEYNSSAKRPRESHFDDVEYEDGFMWECCKKQVDSEGCEMGQHRSE